MYGRADMATVTPRVERYVRDRFPDPEEVLGMLRSWEISYEGEAPSERLVAAAILHAAGDSTRVKEAFELAEQDWSDLLVNAGLAGDDYRRTLAARLGE